MCWAHVKMNYIVCTLQIPNRAINLEKCSTPRSLSFIFCKHVHHCGDMCFIFEGKEDASMEDRENAHYSSNRFFPPMQVCWCVHGKLCWFSSFCQLFLRWYMPMGSVHPISHPRRSRSSSYTDPHFINQRTCCEADGWKALRWDNEASRKISEASFMLRSRRAWWRLFKDTMHLRTREGTVFFKKAPHRLSLAFVAAD